MAMAQSSAELRPKQALLAELESEHYPDRLRAQESLKEWAAQHGDAAYPWLWQQSQSEGSPEVAMRSYEVLKDLVIEALREKRPGYVGITMIEDKFQKDGTELFGVRIRAVQADSPADHSGLRVGDLIFEINGESWSKSGAQDRFAEKVGAMGVGAKVTLKVLRGNEVKEFELELMARPWIAGEYGQGNFRLFGMDGNDFPQSEKEAADRAFEAWLEKNVESLNRG